jgi:hypothetical protein
MAGQGRTWHCSMTASSPVSNLLFHPTSPPPPQCSVSSTTSVVYIVLSDSPRCVVVCSTDTYSGQPAGLRNTGAKGAARWWWWEGCFVPPACRQRMPARLPACRACAGVADRCTLSIQLINATGSGCQARDSQPWPASLGEFVSAGCVFLLFYGGSLGGGWAGGNGTGVSSTRRSIGITT